MFNNTLNLYGSEWLANVFANRNKNYGAYVLRQQSSRNLLKALFITVPVFVAVFIVPAKIAKYNMNNLTTDPIPIEREIVFDNVIRDVKKEVEKPLPAKVETAPKAAPVKTKSVAMSANIKVVKDDLVTLQPPTSADVKDAVVASISQEGEVGKINAVVGVSDKPGNGLGLDKNGGNGNEVHEAAGVDVFPEFPGGMDAWAKYIQRNLRYPAIAQEEGIQGKVFLSFVVEKDGSITDVKVIRGIGYGCDDEAVRVIKKSPRWKAGMQNNLPVRVKYNMPISYMVAN